LLVVVTALLTFVLPCVGLALLGVFAARRHRANSRGNRAASALATIVPQQAAERHWGYLAHDQARTQYFHTFPFVSNTTFTAHDIVWGDVDGRLFETFAVSLPDNTFVAAPGADGSAFIHDLQVVWIPLPAPIPLVQLTQDESVMRGLAALGAARVDMESAEFNREWNVYGKDARICHAVLNPTVIARLLQPDARGREYTFEGAALRTYFPYLTDLTPIEDTVRLLHNIADLVPRFLFEDRTFN
jgi:hypothetical protein